jgi:heme exporter protein C
MTLDIEFTLEKGERVFVERWWFTLHQPASFTLTARPSMPVEMWAPLLVCVIGTYLWMIWLWLLRMRVEVIKRESRSLWVKEALLIS